MKCSTSSWFALQRDTQLNVVVMFTSDVWDTYNKLYPGKAVLAETADIATLNERTHER